MIVIRRLTPAEAASALRSVNKTAKVRQPRARRAEPLQSRKRYCVRSAREAATGT